MAVPCDGGVHRLMWGRRGIELIDHPDLDGELAMVALGGAEPRCLWLYRLWNDAVADGGFLAEWVDESRLSTSWFSWLAMALERMRTEGFHEFLRGLPPARAQRMGEFLNAYPLPWINRAAASVSEAVTEGVGVGCVHASPLLADAVGQRLRRAFVDSVGGRHLSVGAAALIPLAINVGGPEAPSLRGALTGPGRGVELIVDGSWLHRVWAAEAAVIDGDLVLAVDPPKTGLGPAIATIVEWRRDGAAGAAPHLERRPVTFANGRWSSG